MGAAGTATTRWAAAREEKTAAVVVAEDGFRGRPGALRAAQRMGSR